MTAMPQSDRLVEAIYDLVFGIESERVRTDVARAALTAAHYRAQQKEHSTVNEEKFKELLKMFNNDTQLIDELLSGLQREARGSAKQYLGEVRARFKASAGADDFLAGPSQWLQKTGGR